jgi:hypothetical protein
MGIVFLVRPGYGVALLLLGVGLLCSTGCVSKEIEPADIPRVSTSQNSKGIVTLSWASKKGYTYRLLMRDMKTGEWKPVAGSDVFEGTGETITVQDQQNPNNPLPWYSVRPEKTAK